MLPLDRIDHSSWSRPTPDQLPRPRRLSPPARASDLTPTNCVSLHVNVRPFTINI